MLNFGDTVEAAKANTAPVLVIIHRDTDDVKDPVSHLILYVADFSATSDAIKAAGGSVSEPHKIAKTGDTIGSAVDPAGNRVELIEPPPQG
jgi:predicted enzyme related to lactoylglutathione lyase